MEKIWTDLKKGEVTSLLEQDNLFTRNYFFVKYIFYIREENKLIGLENSLNFSIIKLRIS